MSLIKDMLNDLQSRDDTIKKTPEQGTGPKTPSAFVTAIKNPRVYVISFIVLVIIFFAFFLIKSPHHINTVKKYCRFCLSSNTAIHYKH